MRERADPRRERFVVLGQEDAPRTGRDKTTIGFSLPDQPGALLSLSGDNDSVSAGPNIQLLTFNPEGRPNERIDLTSALVRIFAANFTTSGAATSGTATAAAVALRAEAALVARAAGAAAFAGRRAAAAFVEDAGVLRFGAAAPDLLRLIVAIES